MADADPAGLQFRTETEKKPNTLRKRLLGGIAGAVLLAGAGYGGWYALVGSHHVGTDNAYVGADTASVTPMIAAQVLNVRVALDPKELQAHPLRVGLSMDAEIDVSKN